MIVFSKELHKAKSMQMVFVLISLQRAAYILLEYKLNDYITNEFPVGVFNYKGSVQLIWLIWIL